MENDISRNDCKSSNKRELPAFVAGLVVLAVTVIIIISGALSRESYEDPEQWLKILSLLALGSLMVRLFAANWTVKIARRQNRRAVRWSWFAFIFPGIVLTIIGLLRKKPLSLDVNENYSPKKQSAILRGRARELYLGREYSLCNDFTEKALELNPGNKKARELRALSLYYQNNLDEAEKEFEKLREVRYRLSVVYYFLGNIAYKKGDFEKASELWENARVKGNGSARYQINRYWNYRGKFLLSKADVKRKLYKPSGRGADLKAFSYIKGIEEIDEFLTREGVSTRITINDLGLVMRFRKIPKTRYVGINFIEIKEFSHNNKNNQVSFKLIDNSRVFLYYNPDLDRRKEMETLKKYYSAATGE